VAWAAGQLGISSRRHLLDAGAKGYLRRIFARKLKEGDLGIRVIRGQASDQERTQYQMLVAMVDLLGIIVRNNKVYKNWLEDIPEIENDPRYMLPATIDRATLSAAPGGIDLTSGKLNVQTLGGAGNDIVKGIKFHLNPALLAQLQNAPGFVPVIINIQPMTDLRQFLDA